MISLIEKESLSALLKLISLFCIPLSVCLLCFLRQRPDRLGIFRGRHITFLFKLSGKIMNGGIAQLVRNLGEV